MGMGGSSGAGGGSSAGEVSYPSYMEDYHKLWTGTFQSFLYGMTPNKVFNVDSGMYGEDGLSEYKGIIVADLDYTELHLGVGPEMTIMPDPKGGVFDFSAGIAGDQNSSDDWQEYWDQNYDGVDPLSGYPVRPYLYHFDGPYENAHTYDPTTDVAEMEEQLQRYMNSVRSMSARLWEDSAQRARDILTEHITGPEKTAEAMSRYDLIQALPQARAMARFEAESVAINAVNSSAFVIGKAMVEEEALRNLRKISAEIELQHDKMSNESLTQIASQIVSSAFQTVEMERSATMTFGEMKRVEVIMQKEWLEQEVVYDVKAALFFYEMHIYAGNLLGSISGSAVSTPATTEVTKPSVLGGVLSGASMGALMGSPMGPPGAIVGGIAGGLLGGVGASQA